MQSYQHHKGKAKQKGLATAETNFTKPGAHHEVNLCSALGLRLTDRYNRERNSDWMLWPDGQCLRGLRTGRRRAAAYF